MQRLNNVFNTLSDKLDAFSPRERLLVLVTVCVVLYLLVESVALKPLYQSISVKSSLIAEQRETVDGIMNMQKQEKINAENQEKTLTDEMAQLKMQLLEKRKNTHYGLSASDMLMVIDSVVHSSYNLDLIEIANHDAQSIASNVLYAHPVDLIFEGKFVDIYAYIHNLEMLPVPVVFDMIEYEVMEYPKARVHLKISFITQNKGFIQF